jgi:hypothetical protein
MFIRLVVKVSWFICIVQRRNRLLSSVFWFARANLATWCKSGNEINFELCSITHLLASHHLQFWYRPHPPGGGLVISYVYLWIWSLKEEIKCIWNKIEILVFVLIIQSFSPLVKVSPFICPYNDCSNKFCLYLCCSRYCKVLLQEFAVKIDQGFLGGLLSMFAFSKSDEDDQLLEFNKDCELSRNSLMADVMQTSSVGVQHFFDELHCSPIKVKHFSLYFCEYSHTFHVQFTFRKSFMVHL